MTDVTSTIDQTIVLLIEAMGCDAAAMPADTLAEFLQATVEIRNAAAHLVAQQEQAPPAVQVGRNLRETCALLAFIQPHMEPAKDSFVLESLGNLAACARELVRGCADATQRAAAAATAG